MKQKTPEILISAGGIAVLAAIFALWCGGVRYSAAGMTAAVISAVLFALVCLRFVPKWVDTWRDGEPDAPCLVAGPRHICVHIFAAVLLWDVLIIVIVYILRRIFGNTDSFFEALDFWTCTDSGHYLDIARDWYLSEGSVDRLVQLVFLPGYPVVVRLVTAVIGDGLIAGLIVSALCFAGANVMLYKLVLLDYGHETALRAVKFLSLSPAVFFFVAPMSESLFLLCTLGCMYLVRRGKMLPACLLGAYAAFTRSLGVVLIVPVVFELVQRRAKLKDYLCVLIIPLGFAAYCLVNYTVSGDAFKFMQYQREHWGQQLGWFFNTAAYQTENAIYNFTANRINFFGLWLPNLLAQTLSLVLMLFAVRKLRSSYTAYFLAYFVVAIGATWLLSAPRYIAAAFTVPTALATASHDHRADWCLTTLSVLAGAVYLCEFALRWQVW